MLNRCDVFVHSTNRRIAVRIGRRPIATATYLTQIRIMCHTQSRFLRQKCDDFVEHMLIDFYDALITESVRIGFAQTAIIGDCIGW